MRLWWLLLLIIALQLSPLADGFVFGTKADSGWARAKPAHISQLHLLQQRKRPVALLQEVAAPARPFSAPVLQAAPSAAASKATKGEASKLKQQQPAGAKSAAGKEQEGGPEDRDWLAEVGIDIERASQLFEELASKDGTVEYDAFVNHERVQELLEDGLTDPKLIKKIWSRSRLGGKDLSPLNKDQYLELHMNLQLAIANDGEEPAIMSQMMNEEGLDDEDGLAERFVEDPYSKTFDPKEYFDSEAVDFLTAEFKRLAGDSTTLSFDQFKGWDRLQEQCANTSITVDVLNTMWEEATEKTGDRASLNTFLRLNVRFEGLLAMVKPPSPEELAKIRAQYEKVFLHLTGNEPQATFKHILKWSEVREALKQKVITEEELKALFDELATASSPTSKEKAIDVEGFIALDQRLSSLVESEFQFGEDDEYDEYDGEDATNDYEDEGAAKEYDEEYDEENDDEGSDDYEYEGSDGYEDEGSDDYEDEGDVDDEEEEESSDQYEEGDDNADESEDEYDESSSDEEDSGDSSYDYDNGDMYDYDNDDDEDQDGYDQENDEYDNADDS